MVVIPEHFQLNLQPVANRAAIIQFGNVRLTILTERLIRLEYHPQGCFEDRASQTFWYRDQPIPPFTASSTAEGFEVETAYLQVQFRGSTQNGFTKENLTIYLKDLATHWHPALVDALNLRGTTRTLDFINGYAPLEQGLISRSGWSLMDDSATLVLNAEGWLEHREAGGVDWYFFGYGHDYTACLRDFCRVSGRMPLIPRYILGNWWSRYWAYTQQELTDLIEDFARYELPFSVCIVDMDWHITKTNNASTGWTGYTWNRELFPDPQGFMDFAHAQRLKIGLNLHPAEGVHDHEEQYPTMALRLGIDPATKQPIVFEITNPQFAQAYFEVLHHPYEKMGVDFWWVDWQQGQKSALAGLDPLWLINHLHFYDLGRDGTRRPFIFSRWGNQGHQRYPIGFSGDSYISWATLNFQTYMTTTASNIAYGWWSHDIGGHTSGVEDSELLTRWVQFGVFSPINRLHVTKGLWYDRRPWALEDPTTLQVLREALQLRHAFVPYLYTMAYRAHEQSLPLIEPMYYRYPEEEAAYHCPHQYFFGSELIAAPFVNPIDPTTGFSRQVVWLPEGEWVHFFTGKRYVGNRWYAIYGRLGDIPLFAKAGAIVPLASNRAGIDNPAELHVHLFAGAEGQFTLYEDDGATTAYLQKQACLTTFTQTWSASQLDVVMAAAVGETTLIPATRTVQFYIHGVQAENTLTMKLDDSVIPSATRYDSQTETLTIQAITLPTSATLTLSLRAESSLLAARDRRAETVLRLLKFFKLHTGVRNKIADELDSMLADPAQLAPYLIPMSDGQARALFEVLYEAGLHVIYDTHEPTLVLLWNNHQRTDITFRYRDIFLKFGSVQSANSANGMVPMFTHFVPPAKTWQHGARQENVQRTQWFVQIDYANLLTVSEQHTEPSP